MLDRLLALVRQYWVVPATVFAVAGVTIIIATADTDNDGTPDQLTVTVKTERLNGPGRQTVTVPARAVQQVQDTEAGDHAGERRETPDDISPEVIAQARQAFPQSGLTDALTLAEPEQRGCDTKLVGNFSSRNGARPVLWVLHYTVSPNRPGWGDVNAIVSYFNQRTAQASSHYVIDNEGHCALIVHERNKAWTQGFFNPVSISVEIINTGREPTLASTAGLAKIAQVISDSAGRWGIPLRRGATSGCTVTRSGIVDHNSLGCGNNHSDISPYNVAAVIAAAQRARAAKAALSGNERRRCNALRYHRRTVKAGKGYWTPSRVRRVRYLKAALAAKGVDPSGCR